MENQTEEKKAESKHLGCGVCYPHEKKKKSKIIIAFLVIAGLAAGYVLGVIGYIKVIGPYVAEIKYKAFLEEYLKPYKEDFVGGETPEQTIDLFIEALKKGDYELASKYFVVERQEEWKKNLKDAKKENIDRLAIQLENAKTKWHKEQKTENKFEFWYNIGTGSDERTNFIVMIKNVNNKWKIGGF